MSKAILLTADRWAEVWTAINADFPAYRVTEALLAKQGQEWYGELKRYSLGAVNFAWSEYRKKHERRPKLMHLLTLCSEHERRALFGKRRAGDDDSVPPTCACGCGGGLYARQIYDGDVPRMWGVGIPMTRLDIECKRTPLSIVR